MDKILSDGITVLINNNMFYGLVAAQLEFRESTSALTPTIGISPTLIVYYNKDYIKSLEEMGPNTVAAILEHEVHHLLLDHFGRFPKMTALENIACDIAINQHIQNLPLNTLQFRFFYYVKDGQTVQFPPNETAEVYLELLKQNTQITTCGGQCLTGEGCSVHGSQDGQGDGVPGNCPLQVDDHSTWGISKEGSGMTEEDKDKLKGIMKTAADMTERIAGSLPQNVQEILENWLKPPKVPWHRVMRRKLFSHTVPTTDLKFSKYKMSKRFPALPGPVKERKGKTIFFSIDCSGSMPKEELKQAFSEINRLHRLGYHVYVIQWDTDMTEPERFRPKMNIEIKKRGGTNPLPVFNFIEENNKDFYHVMMTDGWWFEYPKGFKYPKKHLIIFTEKEGFNAFRSRYRNIDCLLIEVEK